MTFPRTLHRYILTELIKTFLLTAMALTIILSLGGGVMNMIKLGEVTPDQLFTLLILVLPVSAALTLPMAALFASAATYGRMAADNEFVACRSGGINIITLFLPAAGLSAFAAVVTFAFSSFVIPGMIRNLNELIGADLGAIIQQRLNRPRGLTLGGPYRIFADQTRIDASRPDFISLERVAFLEVDGEEWVKYGTAKEVRLDFTREDNRIRVSGTMIGPSFYDRRDRRFAELGETGFAPYSLDTLVPPEIKFLTLGGLWHFRAHPQEWNEVAARIQKLRDAAGRQEMYEELLTDWKKDQELKLSDARTELSVRAKDCVLAPRSGGLECVGLVVEERRSGRDQGSGHERRFTAERGAIEAVRGDTLADSSLALTVYELEETFRDGVQKKPKDTLGPVRLDPGMVMRLQSVSDDALLAGAAPGSKDEAVEKAREEAFRWRRDVVLRIIATIHERFAFSLSIPVLVILGTALAIIMRGSHVLTAFGVSFLPAIAVIITIVMGKQLAQNAVSHHLGLAVLWSGVGLVVLLDVVTLTRWLRR